MTLNLPDCARVIFCNLSTIDKDNLVFQDIVSIEIGKYEIKSYRYRNILESTYIYIIELILMSLKDEVVWDCNFSFETKDIKTAVECINYLANDVINED